jgi:hypothetical protein
MAITTLNVFFSLSILLLQTSCIQFNNGPGVHNPFQPAGTLAPLPYVNPGLVYGDVYYYTRENYYPGQVVQIGLFNKNADGSSTQIGSASADFHMTYSIYYAWQNYYSAPANLFIQASVLSGLGMVPVYTSPVYTVSNPLLPLKIDVDLSKATPPS